MALPGQAARTGALANKPSRGRPAEAGPAGAQAAGQRLPSATAPVSRTLPFTEALLPQCELGRDHSVRSTSLSWPAGFLNYSLEGRVQKITVHWLTHANTVHRTRTNSLESTAGLETLWPSPAESLQQRGRTARAQRNSTAQGCPRRRLSSSASQATRRQQGSRVQRT